MLSRAPLTQSCRTGLSLYCPFPCSTLVGDIAEVKAIRKVFSDFSHIKMNATKSMIGHCLGAAGGMEVGGAGQG